MGKRQSSLRKRNFALVNDVGCPRKAVGHRNAMSCTRGAVPFKSTVHGPNSEAEPQICDSPDLPLHALLLNCFRLLSYATPRSSPPLTGHRKGTKTKTQRDRRTAEIIGIFFSFFFWVPLSLGRASYGTAQTVAYILSGVTS
ncbi:unnamed protein product [Prunus armeniaca]